LADVCFDTAVVIDCLSGHPAAVEFLADQPAGRRLCISAVSVAELYQGVRDRAELRLIDAFAARFRVVVPTPNDVRHCLQLVRSLKLAHGVGWPDCLIAATCIRLGMSLATPNAKHFKPIPGVDLIVPY